MKTIEENAVRNSEQLMQQINYNLDAYLTDFKKATLPLLNHSVIQQFVKVDPSDQYAYFTMSYRIESEIIPGAVYNRNDIYGLSVISLKGPYFSNIAFADRVKLYTAAIDKKGEDNYRILGIIMTNGTPVITVTRKIIDNETYLTAGYLIIDLSLNRITDIIQNAKLGESGTISIVNSDERYLYHPDSAKWGERLPDSYLQGIKGVNKPYFTYGTGQSKHIVVYNQSAKTGLTIVSEVPLKELTGDLIYFRNLTLGLVLILIVLAFLTIFSFSLSVTRSLSHLLKLMKKAELGDLHVRAPARDDEIGSLNKGFNRMLEDIDRLIEVNRVAHMKEKEMAIRQRESKLQALQARINPHFLYNTLGVINAYAIIAKVKPISQMTVWLSDLFRYSIDNPDQAVPLSEEIKHVFNYMYIQKERYQELLLDADLDVERLGDIATMRFTVQPIVENAFIHGYEGHGIKPSYIGLLAWFDEAGVVLHVIDKGSGMLPEQLDAYNDAFAAVTEEEMLQGNATFGGIGLWNVHSRLRLEFGEPYGLRIVVSGTGGTIVEIKLPYREGKHDVQHPDR